MSRKTLLGLGASFYATGGVSGCQGEVMERSRVTFFFFFPLCLCELLRFPSKYKTSPKRWGGCFGSSSGVQIWMQSNRDAGVGLLGADGSRQTEEEKEGGRGGEHLSPAYLKFSLCLITNHSPDSA